MAHELRYHPLARQEYLEALEFYKQRSISVALDFQSEYERIEDQIIAFPESGHFELDRQQYKKRHLTNYPFTIVYRIQQGTIFILAVAHQSRNPDYWKGENRDRGSSSDQSD